MIQGYIYTYLELNLTMASDVFLQIVDLLYLSMEVDAL